MRKILSWPVRVHLLLLVILLALPSITLIVYRGMAERDESIEGAKSECLKFVNAIAAEQQAAVAGVQQLVVALSLLPEVQTRNVPATDALLSDLLKKNPLYANIVISYKSGVLWATATPAGAPFEGTLSIAGRKYFQDAVRSGTFSSGEFSVGRIGKKPVITFAQPVSNASKELTDVIAVSLNLDHIQSLFEKINLPAGSSFSLLDHQGVILLRNSRDFISEQLVGKRDIREELFTKMVEGPDEGTYEAMGNDGRIRLTAYRKMRLPHESQPYLYIRSSIPKSSVVSEANKAMIGNMAALMSVFAVGLILAVFIGKRMIADPIAKLKEASRQLAAGAAPVSVSEKVKDGELGELAHTFDDMVQALHGKEKLQRAAENALRASEKRLRTVLNSITDGYYALDSEWRFVEMNNVAENHFGHPARELAGKEIWEVTNTPPDSPIYRQYGRAVRENLPLYFEAESQVNPGTWSELHLYPRDGFLDVYFRDITKRKHAGAVLQTTLQRFYAVLSGMQSAILLVADEGRVEYANQAFCDYFDLQDSPADLVNLPTQVMIEKIKRAYLDPDKAVTRIREIVGRGQTVLGEEVAMQGGRTRLRDFIPLHVDGKSYGRLWQHWDITERKQAEEALREANELLEQRVRERTRALQHLTEQLEGSRGDLRKLASELVMAEERERKRIAGVLHDDIAQILATVRMRLDLLGGLPSDQQETLKEAKALLLQSIQETRTLMTDIGNPLLFDMGLKAACESLAKRLMERHAVRIHCDIQDTYKHLNPDVKTILFQVIRELLNNVVKHSRAQNANVTIDMDNGHFSMKVTDDGAGFDPQMLGAPTVDGGFGLYSIRERLLAIGGSLRIESTPGTGTVVTAILPATLN
jgi:PAS domain S-box-containing protein